MAKLQPDGPDAVHGKSVTPSNAETLQRYPEITFTGFKQPLFETRLNWEFTSLYGYYYRDYGVKGSALMCTRSVAALGLWELRDRHPGGGVPGDSLGHDKQ